MTYLSHRIAGLTGADRAIDAEVADVLGWWPEGYANQTKGQPWRRLSDNGMFCKYCPRFTALLDATLAEIRRRGWGTSHVGSILTPQCRFSIHIDQAGTSFDAHRKDDNLALAALEALVRAVEAAE